MITAPRRRAFRRAVAALFAIHRRDSTQVGGGVGAQLVEGTRCIRGSNVRLATKSDSPNASSVPEGGDPTVFERGGVAAVGSAFRNEVDDSLGCVGGPILRLGNEPAAGTSSYPRAGDPSISVRAISPAGGTSAYQCFYRNAVAAFCPPATSNRTNGVQFVWMP